MLLLATLTLFKASSLSATPETPLAKDMVLNVKNFCTEFEAAAKAKSQGSAIAQCIELINSGVAQGRFRFDRVQASHCLTAVKDGQALLSCHQVLLGARAKGASCESSNDCMMPLICLGAQASQNGKCAQPLPEGSSCDDESVYASRFFAASNRGVCAPGLKCTIGRKQVCTKDS